MESLKNKIEKFKEYVIIVEGKNDSLAMKSAGFEKVYEIHKTYWTLRERVEQIASMIKREDTVCILTDLDKTGRQLYLKIKPILQELGIKIDSSFRNILVKEGISHIEEIGVFFKKIENSK